MPRSPSIIFYIVHILVEDRHRRYLSGPCPSQVKQNNHFSTPIPTSRPPPPGEIGRTHEELATVHFLHRERIALLAGRRPGGAPGGLEQREHRHTDERRNTDTHTARPDARAIEEAPPVGVAVCRCRPSPAGHAASRRRCRAGDFVARLSVLSARVSGVTVGTASTEHEDGASTKRKGTLAF